MPGYSENGKPVDIRADDLEFVEENSRGNAQIGGYEVSQADFKDMKNQCDNYADIHEKKYQQWLDKGLSVGNLTPERPYFPGSEREVQHEVSKMIDRQDREQDDWRALGVAHVERTPDRQVDCSYER